jgi:hypothetical protein
LRALDRRAAAATGRLLDVRSQAAGKGGSVRVTAAFSRLLRLKGVWIRSVRFEPGKVVVDVALRRKRLHCPLCGYSTRARKARDHGKDGAWIASL